jgi:mannan endo-1,4-beta-mannosidase
MRRTHPRARHSALQAALLTTLHALLITACAHTTQPHPDHTPPPNHTHTHTTLFGAFTHGGLWHGTEPILQLERDLGRTLDVVHWFTNWENPFFPHMAHDVITDARAPLVSWQPHRQELSSIARGKHDPYVRAWARDVSSVPALVYIRLFPEMNGDWVPWSGDPESFRAAWRHVVTLFAEEGATNARFVFSPNVTDEPRTEANRMEHYYPGDDVVDLFGLSGYNWGSSRPHVGWRSFEGIFRDAHDRLEHLAPHEIWLTEIASSEEGGNKAAWIHDAGRALRDGALPRVTAVIWFDEHKESDWRIRSTPESLHAIREALLPH